MGTVFIAFLCGLGLGLSLEKRLLAREAERARAHSLGALASQVAHDIRSPLAALGIVAEDLTSLPEGQRVLVRRAVDRIRDIANALIEKANGSPLPVSSPARPSLQLIPSLVDALVTEKRIQYRRHLSIDIQAKLDTSTYGLFALVEPGEFKRMLSGLVDEGVKAVAGNGTVLVEISACDQGILLQVGGHRFTLPRAEPPRWFVPKISVSHSARVVVLDDDSSIHQIWQSRFETAPLSETKMEMIHFSNEEEIREWHAAMSSADLFLVDYEIAGSSMNGIEIIRSLGIESKSILVTSRFEGERVVRECERFGIPLLPKGMAGLVPIEEDLRVPDSRSIVAT